ECPIRLLRKRKSLLQHILQSSELSPLASASFVAVTRPIPSPVGPPLGCPSSREMSPTTEIPAQASAPHSTYGRSHHQRPMQAQEPAPASARQTQPAHTLRA